MKKRLKIILVACSIFAAGLIIIHLNNFTYAGFFPETNNPAAGDSALNAASSSGAGANDNGAIVQNTASETNNGTASQETNPAAAVAPPSGQSASNSINRSNQSAQVVQDVSQSGSVSGTISGSIPERLVIPSIKLNDPIQPVGLTSNNAMDVPSGKTSNVGWYEYGTVPGQTGSAVLDAHVFAAFANLKNVSKGDDIYVEMQDGSTSHFRVYEIDNYALADVPLDRLFNDSSGKYLNLITCSGHLTPDGSTYDHRLVVYAELIPAVQ